MIQANQFNATDFNKDSSEMIGTYPKKYLDYIKSSDELINQIELLNHTGMIFIDESKPAPPMIIELDESGKVINGNLEQENTDGRC